MGLLSKGVHVKVMRRSEHSQQLSNSRSAFLRDVYFFYEKNTGVAHFHVDAGPDGRFPVDQAAGLLAMHCMVRGQSTSDYVVMVQAEEEVLAGLMKSLANKEIASDLNLSERTVKFHVSSLLAKFHVRGRMELVREASRQTAGALSAPMPVATREALPYPPVVRSYPAARQAASVVSLGKRQLMA